ncbi:MAG: type II secretion system F family protein [Thermoproteaceae archaeon]|nr:type II secretion system F family protein [Thermoproteaceae archaeon]
MPPLTAGAPLGRAAARVAETEEDYRETVNLLAGSSRIAERPDAVLMARLDWMLRQKQIRAASLARSLAVLFEMYVIAVQLLPILIT